MTDFERKPGDKKNINSTGSDPMMELTRLLGRNNLSSGHQVDRNAASSPVEQDQWRNEDAGFNPYNANNSTSSEYSQGVGNAYAEDNDPIYPQQENAYWSDEGDVSSTGLYAAAGTFDSSNYSTNANYDQQQPDNFYTETSYSDDSTQGYGWSESGGAPLSQDYGYNASGELDSQLDNAFYNDKALPTQGYSVDRDFDAGTHSYSSNYQQNNVADEETYWANGSGEAPSYDNSAVEGQQWTQSLDETEQFENEYGFEPNEGVYRNDPISQLSYDETVVGENGFTNQQGLSDGGALNESYYVEGPQFVDELSQGQTYVAQPVDEHSEFDFAQQTGQQYQASDFETGRPLGSIIAPMRMTTKPQSFLGYGQAVAVLPSLGEVKDSPRQANKSNAKAGLSLGRSNAVEVNRSSNKTQSASSNAPIGRGVNPFTLDRTPQHSQVAPQTHDGNDFEDALNDFNLTIKGDGKKRYKRDPNLRTVRPDQNAVPETQSFDLPSVNYGDVRQTNNIDNALDHEFSDVLSSGLHDTTVTSYGDPIHGSSGGLDVSVGGTQDSGFTNTAHSQEGSLPFDATAADASKYDWGASEGANKNTVQRSGAVKKIVLLLGLLAIILAAIGVYYAFFTGSDAPSQPVVIHRDEGDVRVAPQGDSAASDVNEDRAIYNRGDNSATTAAGQSQLVDQSETPVDLDKVDEQAPHANEASLEPNSVEARVLQATENSLSVHEVPTVTIRDRENVSGDDINSIIANDRDDVLVPGQTFKEHLQSQSSKPQPLPSVDLQSDSPVYANTDIQGNGGNAASLSDDNTNAQSGAGDRQLSSTSGGETDVNSSQNAQVDNNGDTVGGLASLSANNNGVAPNQLGESPVLSGSNASANDVATGAPAQSSHQTTSTQVVGTDHNQTAQVGGATLPAGTFYVQIGSQPSREAAQQSLADIKRQPQANSIIGNRQVVIVAADIPGRGTFYRVRVVASNQAAANQLCEQLKGHQVSCFVGK
ncbi:SPOR domain-containing protein [Bartonella sp. HY329]|uniref:SPOR domain-containing protein n=1 Tax=unclassified Bartonella TaxID=2645622 RepID=UPI0021C62B33|nr:MULTISPECIES: SPOR domain-containing protein [unclassified Bartonella]UXM93935.1 SPOR domain-containing protein [Bartonella sp. HY329]UXN08256.1 SPOR domain-containing protein [Bartonella sp. HY328]